MLLHIVAIYPLMFSLLLYATQDISGILYETNATLLAFPCVVTSLYADW